MNTRKFKIFTALLGLFLAFYACKPEEFSIGEMISKDQLKYSISQDKNDPNMIILESLTPGVTPLWVTPMGRSTQLKDTVKIPFAGEYTFTYGVESAGGYVQADNYVLNLTTNNLNYVDDPLWTLLTGGVGKEKTWVLDLNADAVSKYFIGPLFFYGTDDSWVTVTDKQTVTGDSWNWSPDYPGNSWLMAAGDYGTMTFSLKGGAKITVDHKMLGKTQTGTYFLDASAKTLKMTDAGILHDSGRDKVVIDWGNLKVLSLTENTMQLAALRDPALSGEGACLLVYNFISKDYSDNWVKPEPEGDPNFDFGLDQGEMLAVNKTKTWSLSSDTPFNWYGIDGTELNAWSKNTDYPDWAGYNASYASYVSACQIQFSSDGAVKTVDGDGVEAEGTYAIDETTNTLTFTGITPAFKMGSWAVATTTAANQWKILKIKKTGSAVTDIWFGKRDPSKSEYMGFHFVLGASAGSDPVAEAKKAIIKALCGTSSKSFKVSDSWHVDWCDGNYSGGWTTATTFADDFTSNSWVWTAEVKQSIQDPRLTFSVNNGEVTCTKTQDGVTTSAGVTIDGANNTIKIDMDLIKFGGAANWLPSYGPNWKICRNDLADIDSKGMWLGVPSGKDNETLIIHYVVAQ